MGDAVATLTRAFKGYVETGDLDRALAVANQPTPIEPELRGLAQLLADALELVPQDSHQAGSLLPTYGRALGVEEGDYEGAQEAFKRALVIAQREQDQALEMWTQAWAGGVDGLHLRSQLELQAGLRAIELSGTIGNIAAEWMGHIWASRAHSELGDPARAWPHAGAALAIAERLRDRSRLEAPPGPVVWTGSTSAPSWSFKPVFGLSSCPELSEILRLNGWVTYGHRERTRSLETQRELGLTRGLLSPLRSD